MIDTVANCLSFLDVVFPPKKTRTDETKGFQVERKTLQGSRGKFR